MNPSPTAGHGLPRRKSSPFRRAMGFVRDCLAVMGLFCLVSHVCFEVSDVGSPSMSPTLCGDGHPGSDWILYERISYWFRDPRRWEVVQFQSKDPPMIVAKRVVGLPGEEISLVDRRAAVDGVILEKPASLGFLDYLPYGNLAGGRKVDCGRGYFLLGDESGDSLDSRFEGVVLRSRIRARAWMIVWPLSRFGFVRS